MKPSQTASKKRVKSEFTLDSVLAELKAKGNPRVIEGMARYGIHTSKAYGVSVPQLRDISRKIGQNHELALRLWTTGIHEGRIVAGLIDDPTLVSEAQMENWAKEFDSWDVVDGTCGNLFDRTPYAVAKAHEWSERKEEYVKRAGFVMMAELAVHDKKQANKTFTDFLPLTIREASDERNFVKKAVNWAIRQIGKRNLDLNAAAIRTCKDIQKIDSRSARWIAADALRELTSLAVQKKLKLTSERSKSN